MDENSTTGQESNEDSTVANSETIDQLQAEVESLETRLKHSRKEKKELEQQLANVEREKNILKDGTVLNRRLEQIRELERENQQLRQQLQTADASLAPDYEATRDRTLNKLKVGKQSTAGKAIEAFIKELKHGL
ncbi:hypothetical protein ACWATR_18365 [Nostoc sp. UIC 10890]